MRGSSINPAVSSRLSVKALAMPDETKSAEPEKTAATATEAAEPKIFISGSTITAFLFAVPAVVLILGTGLLNILAALGGWNPFHWQGRLWTGLFMIAAPSALGIMAALPYRIRSKMPDAAASITVILVWIAFFWAACGGH